MKFKFQWRWPTAGEWAFTIAIIALLFAFNANSHAAFLDERRVASVKAWGALMELPQPVYTYKCIKCFGNATSGGCGVSIDSYWNYRPDFTSSDGYACTFENMTYQQFVDRLIDEQPQVS